MNVHRGAWLVAWLGMAGLFWGCDRTPEGWTPVLEETSTVFLETETDRIHDHVRTALEHLQSDPERAEEALTEAEVGLGHLQGYYLPLFRARERAYNAYRYHHLGNENRTVEELQKIEDAFEEMAVNLEDGELRELQALTRTVADARIAALADTETAGPLLESLARRLDMAVLKGDLILNPND
jgi:plasmid stabilization system protein ParE